jgi:photosystem II stability/assembly factor-like uncharacterized protein
MIKVKSYIYFFLISYLLILSQKINSQWANVYTEQSNSWSSFFSIYFTSDNTGYAARGDSSIIKTTNGGLNWFSLNGTSLFDIRSIQFATINTGYAVGENYQNRIGYFLKTTNAGTNWSQIQFSGVRFRSLKFIDENLGYVLTDSNFVYKTTNGGVNWEIQSLNGSYMISFDFADANNGFVSGHYLRFYRTTNGGANWITSGRNIFEMDFVDANTGYSTVLNILSSDIIKTTNGGLNWSIVYTRDTSSLNDLFFINNNTGWVLGEKNRTNNIYDGFILKTTNGGVGWFEQFTGLQHDSSSCFSSLFMVNSNLGYASTILCQSGGPDLRGKIFKTTNGGGGPIGIEPVYSNIPENYILHQNYPNPFNPVTKISFEIPVSVTNVSTRLIVYDVTGKEVSVLVDEQLQPGKYEIDWNAEDLTSGVYFYTLSTGNYKETKKMLLIK